MTSKRLVGSILSLGACLLVAAGSFFIAFVWPIWAAIAQLSSQDFQGCDKRVIVVSVIAGALIPTLVQLCWKLHAALSALQVLHNEDTFVLMLLSFFICGGGIAGLMAVVESLLSGVPSRIFETLLVLSFAVNMFILLIRCVVHIPMNRIR